MNIAVIGLGLIGGSFAKAIKKRTAHRVFGHDISPDALEQALASGAVDSPLEEQLAQCSMVLIALFPADAIAFLEENIHRFPPGCLVVDLCGIKREICDRARDLFRNSGAAFIGGHPMAGREVFGFVGSTPDLFLGASMILTPEEDTPAESLAAAETFFRSVGFAHIQHATPAHHDHVIAFTSQLAHVLSSAYVQCPAAGEHMGFSAGSFQDLTRVARLNEFMWSELFLHNADYLAAQIDDLIDGLDAFRHVIARKDQSALLEMLRRGRRRKEALDSKTYQEVESP